MARVAQLNQNPKDTQQTTAGGQQPTQIQATNPFTGQSAPTAPAAGGSRFTNVSSYLKANEGAGEKIAEKVGNKVQQTVNKTQEQQTQAEGFRDAVNAEKDRLAQASGMAEQAKNDATAITADQAKIDAWNKLYNPTGTSTNQITEGANLAGKISTAMGQAGQQVANLGSESGRFDLLGQTFARPNYSQGQKRLDQLLLSVGGAQQLGDASKNLGSQLKARGENIDAITKAAGEQVAANAKAEGEASTLLRNTVNTTLGGLRQAQVDEALAANTQNAKVGEALNAYFSGGVNQLTPEQKEIVQAELAKGSLNDTMRTYNVTAEDKWKNYINTGRTDLGAGDVLDANEFAKYQALGTLGQMNPENMEFTKAGEGNVAAGLKAEELAGALTGAREDLIRRFANETLTRNKGTQSGPFSSDEWMSANLADLLRSLENNDTVLNVTAGNINQSGQASFDRNQQGTADFGNYFTERGYSGNTGNFGAYEAYNLWQDFLNRLETEGYNKGLGGISPTATSFGGSYGEKNTTGISGNKTSTGGVR